ncbi:MAG: hypothetical protein K6G33_05615 [Ruminococcus sp.]|uniref:serpin family protein n=1 Tax=Ruminococcus sp. TaxID=41978 RepID=UPI0025F709AC|nr:serpin family protein [Ruminococcus sp.]MCR5600203.1 hypothetical protein [Ruminococcus sp.]
MKKFKRITSGVISLALAMGTAAIFPPPPSRVSAIGGYSIGGVTIGHEPYELELKNAYIARIDTDDDMSEYYREICLIMPDDNGYYPTYHSFNLRFRSPEVGGEWFENSRELENKWNITCNLFDKLSEDEVVTLKIEAYDKDEFTSLKKYIETYDYEFHNDCFDFDSLTSVRSLSIHFYGDINDDGVVDCFDVIAYRKLIAGSDASKLSDAEFLNGDINFDDKIDEDDLRQVQDYLLGKEKSFNGIANINSIRLDNKINVEASEGKSTDEKFAAAEMKFGVDVLKNCFDPTTEGEENLLISPLSLSTALAMTANGAEGKTKTEIEKLLGNGLTMDEINEYMAYYASQLPDEKAKKIYLANSIWFKDKDNFKVLDKFLEANKKYYDAQIFKAPFDDTTVKDVNSWCNQNTKGMIPKLLNDGALTPNDKEEIVMMLINTLYFEAEWSSVYRSSTDGKFTDLNGIEHPIKELHSMERQYFDLGDADAFKKNYVGSDYSFVGILPKEKNIVDYVNGLDAEKLMEGLKECVDPNTIDLYVMIPKFKYNYSKGLKEVLAKMGMGTAFDPENANFSDINDRTVDGAQNTYISDVLHKTRIEVTEKGTKAAAVSAVLMSIASAAPIQKKEIHIDLNRPFVYMIVDKNNVPLFIGAVTDLE